MGARHSGHMLIICDLLRDRLNSLSSSDTIALKSWKETQKERVRKTEGAKVRERESARAFFTQQNTQTLTVRAGKIGNRGAIVVRKKETYQGRWGVDVTGVDRGSLWNRRVRCG